MDQDEINEILSDLESGYDRMADKFSETRKFPWSDLAFISDYVRVGDNILDYGCGNGRLLEILKNKNISYVGADVSRKLIEAARTRYQSREFIKISSQGSLPFPDNSFNEVISVAVFHHFPPEYAGKMAGEIFRVAKPGGKIIITAWNLWQRRFWKYIFDARKLFKKEDWRDISIPFENNQGEIFDRYHHVYTKRELEKIFSRAGFRVEKSFVSAKGNIIVIAEKK